MMTPMPWDRITDGTYKIWLINRQVAPDEFNELSVVDRSTLRTQFEQQQQQNSQQDGGDSQTQFRDLLKRAGISPVNEVLMNVVLKHFAANALMVNTPDQAKDLYYEASMLPRSATQIVLQKHGISVADVFRGSDPSKAVLLHAHERGNPRILKIANQQSIQHELEVWNAVADYNEQNSCHLVPLRQLKFESAQLEIGDIFGGASVVYPNTRSGVLMTHYQGTLTQCKIPLTEDLLLHFGQQLLKAVRALHTVGYCHLDIKPSNIFLLGARDDSFADCFLGDYGAAVKTGNDIHEKTVNFYPKDGSFVAEPISDMYLLAVTLLEMSGSIPKAFERGQMTKDEIRGAIDGVESDAVRKFILSLLLEVPDDAK